MKQVILLKLGEVVLKGQNRYRFEQLLLKNVRQALADIGPVELRSIQSTIYVLSLIHISEPTRPY